MYASILLLFSNAQVFVSKPEKRLDWVSSLDCFAFLEGLFDLVVQFHVLNAMQAGVWVSRLDSLLVSRKRS